MSDYVIYGLRKVGTDEYRYVGLTTVGWKIRLRGHRNKTYSEKSTLPVHNWIRSIGFENVELIVLEECPEGDYEYLLEAEAKWENRLREDGCRLKNATECGKPNPRMKGENHPLYGKGHSEESRRKISDNHADVSGKKNPNYGKGKFGSDNASYGKKHSPERIQNMLNGRRESLTEHKKHEKYSKEDWNCPWCCYAKLYGVVMSDFE